LEMSVYRPSVLAAVVLSPSEVSTSWPLGVVLRLSVSGGPWLELVKAGFVCCAVRMLVVVSVPEGLLPWSRICSTESVGFAGLVLLR